MIRSLPGVPRVFFACISAHRPQQVKPMEDAFGPMTWYVPEDEVHSYRSHHAKSIVPTTSLSQARNAALNDAFERDCICVQVADDFKRMLYLPSKDAPREWITEGIRIPTLTAAVIQAVARSDFYLGGVPPTNNPFFASSKIKTRAFCCGFFWVVKPNILRVDENLLTKEDYDYTLQHITRFGGVCRCDWLVMDFDFRKMPGGCQSIPRDEIEVESVAYLIEKWGDDLVKKNSRRQNEVLLKFPGPRTKALA
jgi:hypothetical protein